MGVTLLLVIITGVISFYAFNNAEIMSKLIFNPYLVQKKNQYYRFITSGFIHADIPHLVFNMFSLYFMGQYVEQFFEAWFGPVGMLFYLGLYLLAIVVADIPTYLKHQKDYNYNGLGASGGVAAVIFSLIMIAPTNKIYIYFIPMPSIVFGVLYLVYSYYQGKKGGDNINHDAHFYGALFGIAYTIAIQPEVVTMFIQQLLHWDGKFF